MVLTALAPSQLAWDLPGAMLGTCPCARIRKPIWLRRVCVGALLTCTACQLVLWMLWAVSAAQRLLLDQAENRSDPLRVVSTIEAVAMDGSAPGAVVYRSPKLPMPCAPGSYSCMTNYFSFVDC